ncbi:hypothetical protein BGZ97_004316 [Linnemannia gamsii]|uniref:Uncharacterized protein n=1 Tax=Linnemannia gamsii TaxID=64522 RepID=A0A9P6QUF0_9FUNG|nr:hypothetical protein BGZ97_004316 [Linnemannia gamsii]
MERDPDPNRITTRVLLAEFPGAKSFVTGIGTFFHLKDGSDTVVLVCHTLSEDGVNLFHQRNVTNVILDFQSKTGGLLDFSAFLVHILFPNKHSLDAAFISDMRVFKLLQELTKLTYGTSAYEFFNAHDFISFSNGSAYSENNDVVFICNGRRNIWTEKIELVFTPLTTEQQVTIAEFPWTAKAEHIRLLSDGHCGSALLFAFAGASELRLV